MSEPQGTVTGKRADQQTGAVAAIPNTHKVVDLSVVLSELTKLEDFAPTVVPDIKTRLEVASVETLSRAPGTREGEFPGTAAIIVTKGRALQTGDWMPDKNGIYIGEFDLVDAYGRRLGLRTRWFDAAIELGMPKTFNDTAKAVANSNENGRGGLTLNPARYETDLFEKLKTGEAIGKNVIAPRQVVKAIYALRNAGKYKRMSDGDLPGKLITKASGTDVALWQWSCTPLRDRPDGVRAVDFTDGNDDCYCRDYVRLSGRGVLRGVGSLSSDHFR
jgi:hypothetical protein